MNYYLRSRVIRMKIFKLLTMIRWKWKIQKFKSFQSLIQLNLQDMLSILLQGLMMKENLNSKEDTENLQLLAKSLKSDGRDATFQLSPKKNYLTITKLNLLMNAAFCSKDSWKNARNMTTSFIQKSSNSSQEELAITSIKCC